MKFIIKNNNDKEDKNQMVKFKDGFLNEENYNFLVQLEKSGKYTWKIIKEKIKIENKLIIWEGTLDIIGTDIDFQLKVIEQINNKKLEVKGKMYFGGNIEGIEKLCNNKNLVIPGDLDIKGTSVKSITAKNIWGDVNAEGEKKLTKIEMKEEIGGDLNIKGTSVKSITAKNIWGDVNAEGEKKLTKIEIKEKILGDLNIKGTNIDFQLNIIEQINNKKLEVKGKIYF